MKCCGIQEGIKLQMTVSFPESIHTCSPESAQKVGFCFNTRAEGIRCALLASIIVHQGCICVDVQFIYSRFQESHSIPGLSLSPAYFFSGLRGSQTKSFSILDSADSSLKILASNPELCTVFITISLNAKSGPLTQQLSLAWNLSSFILRSIWGHLCPQNLRK